MDLRNKADTNRRSAKLGLTSIRIEALELRVMLSADGSNLNLLSARSASAESFLDPSFGDNGVVHPTGPYSPFSLARESNGELLTVEGDGLLHAYTVDGKPDPAFGVGGISPTSINNFYPYQAAFQRNGQILVAGAFGSKAPYDLAVARYNQDGKVDATFGTNGVADTGSPDDAFQRVAVQDDGTILAACTYSDQASSDVFNNGVEVAHLFANGAVDRSFGENGTSRVPIDSTSSGLFYFNLAPQSDDKILLAGSTLEGGISGGFFTRMLTSGALDPNFNGGQVIHSSLSIYSISEEPDGKILVAGHANPRFEMAVAQYDARGAIDGSFATAGIASVPFYYFTGMNDPSAAVQVAVDPAGHVVLIGGSQGQFAAARLLANGAEDTSFGDSGTIQVPVADGGTDDVRFGLVLPDGGIIVGGEGHDEFAQLLPQEPAAAIAGVVYADANANRIQDAGEAGLPGTTIFLDLNENGTFDAGEPSAPTDANGVYALSGIAAGNYVLRVSLPQMWRETAPAATGTNVALGGADLSGIDFGATNLPPVASPGGPYSVKEATSTTIDGSHSAEVAGSIASYAWDFNYDGNTFTTDATGAKPAFSAAAIDGPATRTIALKVTDAVGNSAIATATVTINNVPPSAKFTAGGSVKLGSTGSVSFSSQSDPSAADMAASFKYSYDFNSDGKFEITDSSAASATVPAIYLATVGNHTIRGRIKDKDGGFTDYTTTITVTAPTTLASISGTVFADNNGNAKLDTGELGVSGRKFYIDKNKNGVLDAGEPTFTTAANGVFKFSGLAAGTYRIRDVLPSGWRRTLPTTGYFDVTVTAGQTVTGKNFAETTRGLISGVVFKDANGNGIKDSSEVGLAGWVVFLDTNNNGKLDAGELSFTTGSDGKFSFVVSAGTYHLREVLKSGFKITTPSGGVLTITLGSGKTATAKNFGDK